MAENPKQKVDLIRTFHIIERYHRRRTVFVMHVVLSLAFQVMIWANWYGSYAARGVGFEGTFFTDRIGISIALVLFLVGHFVLMYMSEAKDRLVIRALERYQDGLET